MLHRLPSDVQQADLQNHLVAAGRHRLEPTVRRILSELKKLPIEQIEDERLPTGEVFRVKKAENREEQIYFPETEETTAEIEVVEDLALIARLPNPFNSSRTLTICNGVHSRGVLGAVLTLTDETVRPANEKYIAKWLPVGRLRHARQGAGGVRARCWPRTCRTRNARVRVVVRRGDGGRVTAHGRRHTSDRASAPGTPIPVRARMPC